MNNVKKLLVVLAAFAVAFSLCAALAGCGETQTENPTTVTGEKTNYTVSVKSAGGMALEGVSVSVFADDTLKDLEGFNETDANGQTTVELPEGGNYAISLSGVPKGYAVESSYSFNGTKAEIVLTSSVIEGENLAETVLGLGDVMYDFSVTTPDGTEVKLSEMLQEKKMVLLNFWYTGCSWCVTEFPFMEDAYKMYQDKVGIIALDPMNESDDAIAAFPASYSLDLTFPLASCPTSWSNTFSISGYPTSVIIDRYGVICLIESGAITSLRPFTCLFEAMTADDYEQKLYGGVGELVTQVKPTYEMDSSENIAALINSGEVEVTYRPETEEGSAEYAWPFIAAEKNGEQCLKASAQGIDDSFAAIYMDVTLQAGQAMGFDYLISSELGSDMFHVFVEDELIYSYSGVNEVEKWDACYPLIADKDGTYEIALFFTKDDSNSAGDDTVYIKNVRAIDPKEINAQTYLPRKAAVSEDGFSYEYVDVVLSSKDNYYHVGTEDGPLLLVDLMNPTDFNEENSIWMMAYEGQLVQDGHDYADELTSYSQYASNTLSGSLCSINQELYELLHKVDEIAGFDETDDKEWMKACKYYEAYGTTKQLEDPIAGLTPFSAYKATLGTNVETNFFYYDRIIMPRGLFAEFVPSRSGVYRITSRSESTNGVDGWIFNENREELLVYEHDERMYTGDEVSMVYYMEAGTPYYIDIAFWDPYEVGYIYYDIEYVAPTYNLFRICSPGYFTYDTDATGDAMYHTIAGGIDVVLGSDGIYYEDLGDGRTGSAIYADFTGLTLINTPIATVGNVTGLVEKGAFDFSKTEYDAYILTVMSENDNDVEKTEAALKEMWGEDYDANCDIYQVEDVFAGKYHGTGEDLTADISKYLDKIIYDGSERDGCVVVTEELAKILQKLMDKYTFENVDDSWRKLCYYYDYLGPEG